MKRPASSMSSATDTYTLLGAFVDELARCGMRDACTSPGSRSTPLVLSLAREQRLRCHSHIDERCSGFFALGLAKASGLPVAITCTSGTAVAELLPAVVEAREARVPLIVLSADRPPELRELGAGQTIDQLKIFGDFAKWFFEVGTHEASSERVRWMRTLACRAWWTALEGRPGVVHLNFPLREPLVCDELPEAPAEGRPDGQPYVSRPAQGWETGPETGLALSTAPSSPVSTLFELIRSCRRGVLVAGRHERGTPLGHAAAAILRAPRLAAARRPDVGRAAREGGCRALRRSAARTGVRARAQARLRPARRRSARVKAAAHMACGPQRHTPGHARPGGRLARPGERPLDLARGRAGGGAERAHGHARRLDRA